MPRSGTPVTSSASALEKKRKGSIKSEEKRKQGKNGRRVRHNRGTADRLELRLREKKKVSTEGKSNPNSAAHCLVL